MTRDISSSRCSLGIKLKTSFSVQAQRIQIMSRVNGFTRLLDGKESKNFKLRVGSTYSSWFMLLEKISLTLFTFFLIGWRYFLQIGYMFSSFFIFHEVVIDSSGVCIDWVRLFIHFLVFSQKKLKKKKK